MNDNWDAPAVRLDPASDMDFSDSVGCLGLAFKVLFWIAFVGMILIGIDMFTGGSGLVFFASLIGVI